MTMLIVFLVLLALAFWTWQAAGRDPLPGKLVSRPNPPLEPASSSRSMSAAAIDFVRNRGRLSAYGMAAVLYNLRSQGWLEINRVAKGIFALKPGQVSGTTVYPENSALLETFLKNIKEPNSLRVEREQGALLRELNASARNALRKQYRSLWKRNLLFVLVGYALAIIGLAIGLAAGQGQETLRQNLVWALLGLALASALVFGLQNLIQGYGLRRKVLGAVVAVAAAVAGFLVVSFFSRGMDWLQVSALALILLLPPLYTLLIKAPTLECRNILDQIAGFADYLKKLPEQAEIGQDLQAYALVLANDKSWLNDLAGQLKVCLRSRKKAAEPEQPEK